MMNTRAAWDFLKLGKDVRRIVENGLHTIHTADSWERLTWSDFLLCLGKDWETAKWELVEPGKDMAPPKMDEEIFSPIRAMVAAGLGKSEKESCHNCSHFLVCWLRRRLISDSSPEKLIAEQLRDMCLNYYPLGFEGECE